MTPNMSGVDAFTTWAYNVIEQTKTQGVFMSDPIRMEKGLYSVKADEVEAAFVAYWNGRKFVHPAMKYGIHINTWVRL